MKICAFFFANFGDFPQFFRRPAGAEKVIFTSIFVVILSYLKNKCNPKNFVTFWSRTNATWQLSSVHKRMKETSSKEILLFRNSPAVSAEKSYGSVAPAGISTPMVSGAPTAPNSLFPGRFRAEKKGNSETND